MDLQRLLILQRYFAVLVQEFLFLAFSNCGPLQAMPWLSILDDDLETMALPKTQPWNQTLELDPNNAHHDQNYRTMVSDPDEGTNIRDQSQGQDQSQLRNRKQFEKASWKSFHLLKTTPLAAGSVPNSREGFPGRRKQRKKNNKKLKLKRPGSSGQTSLTTSSTLTGSGFSLINNEETASSTETAVAAAASSEESISVSDNDDGPMLPGKVVSSYPIMTRQGLTDEFCRAEPFKQRIHVKGCVSKTFVNNYCYGHCHSFFIPKPHRTLQSMFQSSSCCRPKETVRVEVSLDCPKARTNRKTRRRRRVLKVLSCSCTAENCN